MYSFKNLIKDIKTHKKEFLFAQFIALLAVLISIPLPLLMPILIDEVLLDKPGIWTRIISKFFLNCDGSCYILITLFVVLFLRSLNVFLNILQTYHFEKITKDIANKIRYRLLKHLKLLSTNEFENLQTGDIASRVINDIETIEDFLVRLVSKFAISIFTLIGISIILLMINWQLGLFIIILNPFVVILSIKLSKKVKIYKKEHNKSISLFQEALLETLELFEQIKAFNKENLFFQKLFNLSDSLKEKSLKFNYKIEAYNKFSFLIFLLGFEVFRAAGIFAVFYGNLSIGLMIAVFSYLWYMMTPIQELISMQYRFFAAKAALDRINEILSLEIETTKEKIKFDSTITIKAKNLSFKYKSSDWILKNINFTINPNKITALIGASGEGKTTLAKIIAGFLEPKEGEILYNNISSKDIDLSQIRENINLILQEHRLFNDTLLFNITLSKKFSEEEIYNALKLVEMYDVVNKWKNGLNTYVGKNGVKLSGGQRQRIVLARAILHKPKVIILDESTSALDVQTEHKVFENIKEFLKQRTTIIIAHRPETITKADEVLILQNKEIKKLD